MDNNLDKYTVGEYSKKVEKPTFFYKIKCHFKSYCKRTGIHGFQYFGENRTILEKCWWIFSLIGIIGCCIFAISLIYNKWQQTPVIVSLTTRDTPIYEIPFPAVTICPTIKFSKGHINLSELIKQKIKDKSLFNITMTKEKQDLLEYILPLCKYDLSYIFKNWINNTDELSDKIYRTLLVKNPLLRRSFFNQVKFMAKPLNLGSNFNPVLTEEGLCISFNMLSSGDIFTEKTFIPTSYNLSNPKSSWIPQHGYSKDADLLQVYPRRALLSGSLYGLEMKLYNFREDIDFKCTGPEQGFKVILHFPSQIPRPTSQYTLAPFGKSTTIFVTPQMMATSDVVKTYPPEKRDCYFEDERKLSFFKIYSKSNCEFECLTNYTLKECGCVGFYMPRETSTPICGLAKRRCVVLARRKFNLDTVKSQFLKLDEFPDEELNKTNTNSTKRIKRSFHNFERNSRNSRCSCLRACSDIWYVSTATTVEYGWAETSTVVDRINKTSIDFTYITIFLDVNTITTTERNELYGPTDFLSNFGGLLGLFTGSSILSVLEIIYFCTLRIIGNRKILGKWYGDKYD